MAGNPVAQAMVRIVDLTAPDDVLDGQPHDYRIEAVGPGGAHVLFGAGEKVTADDIVARLGITTN